MEWKNYLNDRLIRYEPEGFYIIVPADAEPIVPIGCDVCHHVMRTIDDEASYLKFKCCDRCARLWAYPNVFKWNEGWRPTEDEVKAAENDRLPLSIKFEVD